MSAVGGATGKRLMEGSEAIATAAVAAGCRFFAGYPMTPFTELLEHMARLLPGCGGVCINAESEIEAVGMAWGALAAGARAATGSTGQGLALMQESLAEITLAELPLVVFDMARGQGDYFQATRGGGHGDYRHIVLAPIDVTEAVALTRLAFDLGDQWRNPVLVYGDYLLAHTAEAVLADAATPAKAAPKDWAVDGSLGGTGRSRLVSSLGVRKGAPSAGSIPAHFEAQIPKQDAISRAEVRSESAHLDGAEHVVVSFGTAAKFVRYVVDDLRAGGVAVGYLRPVTLWPFPYDAIRAAAGAARTMMVFELNGGQMIDDVMIGAGGLAPVIAIGGISTDRSGFGVGPLLDVDVIRQRILAVVAGDRAVGGPLRDQAAVP